MATEPDTAEVEPVTPRETLGRLFRRFLGFGFLAWGGPGAQIAMIQQALVDEERWISRQRFRRVLAVYQALPGPEAFELCVYFGMLSRGRAGGIAAGLGFMLPGFILMLALAWLYVHYGLGTGSVAAAFVAIQAAVVALVVRAVFRIGAHAVSDRWLLAIAVLAGLAHLAGVHFAVVLGSGAAAYLVARRVNPWLATTAISALLAALVAWSFLASRPLVDQVSRVGEGSEGSGVSGVVVQQARERSPPTLSLLAGIGLKSGLLTFGGAYTAIPLLHEDAVIVGERSDRSEPSRQSEEAGWMTEAEFLDGLALSAVLPAPLIIFATFVGFLGGGWSGALVVTLAIFGPAFAITLFGHAPLERLVSHSRPGIVLEGITAAAVGLIGGAAASLAPNVLSSGLTSGVFVVALGALFAFNSRWAVPAVIGAAALAGLLASPG